MVYLGFHKVGDNEFNAIAIVAKSWKRDVSVARLRVVKNNHCEEMRKLL